LTNEIIVLFPAFVNRKIRKSQKLLRQLLSLFLRQDPDLLYSGHPDKLKPPRIRGGIKAEIIKLTYL